MPFHAFPSLLLSLGFPVCLGHLASCPVLVFLFISPFYLCLIFRSSFHGSDIYLLSLCASRTRLPMQETQEMWVQSVGWEDPLGEEMASHSSILAWEIPWTEEPGGLQSLGLQRV